MYTQFFGSYLLNKKIVTNENLVKALELKNTTRVKLGVLAINAGYLTAKQVDMIHRKQSTVDKRIGDLAVEMGLLTNEQVEELLSSQKTGCLVLGQSLVDMGCLTNEEFENVLKSYKAENGLEESDFKNEETEKANDVIGSFYKLDESNAVFAEYINMLFKTIVRFVGDDFTPLTDDFALSDDDTAVMQNITGEYAMLTSIGGKDDGIIGFAMRYSGDEIVENDDYAKDCVSEFLNQANGLFNVNVSDKMGKELGLTPQTVGKFGDFNAAVKSKKVSIPLAFPFGTVVFTVTA